MKKPFIIVLLGCCTLQAQVLIQPVAPPPPPPASLVAQALVDGCNTGLQDRVARMKSLWETLWENERATPAEILEALDTKAVLLFQAAAAAREDLETMAGIAGTTAAALLGDAKYLAPARPITIHADGRVTINP